MLQCGSTQIKQHGIATRKETMYLFSLEGELVILRILKHSLYFFFFKNIYLFIFPHRVLVVACGIFSVSCRIFFITAHRLSSSLMGLLSAWHVGS